MDKQKVAIIIRLVLIIVCFGWAGHPIYGKKMDQMRSTTKGKRKAARRNQPRQKERRHQDVRRGKRGECNA